MALFATSLISFFITLAATWWILVSAPAAAWSFLAICMCVLTAGHLFVCWHGAPARRARRALRAWRHRAFSLAGRRRLTRPPRAMPRPPT